MAMVALVATVGGAALYYERNHSGGTSATTGVNRTPKVTIGTFTGVRPTVIDFSADGASAVTSIRWSAWGSARATGSGT
jgi:hypothetical protein